jgi:hypothetical protein
MTDTTNRRVFVLPREGQEIEVVDLASLRVGDVFRMAPPDGVDDPKLDRRWFRVTDEAVTMGDNQMIQCDPLTEVPTVERVQV